MYKRDNIKLALPEPGTSFFTAEGEQTQLPICAVPEYLHCTARQKPSYPLDCAMYKFFAVTTKNKPSK